MDQFSFHLLFSLSLLKYPFCIQKRTWFEHWINWHCRSYLNRLNRISFVWNYVQYGVAFTSSITTIICTITKSIITSTNRTFYKNWDFHVNYVINVRATVLVRFTGHTSIGYRQIVRDLLPKPIISTNEFTREIRISQCLIEWMNFVINCQKC